MSTADTKTDRAIARDTTNIIKGISAALGGKERGPDARVRRDSYDVDDVRANPWAPIGDGSVDQGLAHRDALLQAAEEHRHQSWKDLPAQDVRAARKTHNALSAELSDYLSGTDAAIGRPAVLRLEVERLGGILKQHELRVRRTDVTVLKAIICCMEFSNGRMFPTIATIAEKAGCHPNTVNGAIVRLKVHGFIDWVRRSQKTKNEGQFAQQREQTSNAYYFDHRRKMASRTWQRFWQLLVAKLRRFGATPAGLRPASSSGPPTADVLVQRAALASLGASLVHAST